MDVQKVLFMNGGESDTSYAKNSSMQKGIIEATRSVVEEAVLDLCRATFPDKLSVVDLGCSSGPNTLSVVSDVVDVVEERCRQLGQAPPEFQLFMNDLPGNDFNTVFRSLEAFYEKREESSGGGGELRRCFVAGVPGSFYGRLFPIKSIHFFHSSTSLQWLSQVWPVTNAVAKIFEFSDPYLACSDPYLACGSGVFFLFFGTERRGVHPSRHRRDHFPREYPMIASAIHLAIGD